MAAQPEQPTGREKTNCSSSSPRQGGGGRGRGGGGAQDEEEADGSEGGGGETAAEEERECRICYNPFDGEARAPKVLECLHTFCLHCLSQMSRHQARAAANEEDDDGGLLLSPLPAVSLACPLCRHRTTLPGGRPHDLPLNTKLAPPPARLQGLPLAEAARPALQRPLPEPGGQSATPPAAPAALSACRPARVASRRQEVRTVRCVCIVFTFFSVMVVSITGPLFLNYSGWVELFMVSLFLVVAVVLALFSLMPYLLHSHEYRTVTAAFLAGERASGPLGPAATPGRS